jgi:hypothetical protein
MWVVWWCVILAVGGAARNGSLPSKASLRIARAQHSSLTWSVRDAEPDTFPSRALGLCELIRRADAIVRVRLTRAVEFDTSTRVARLHGIVLANFAGAVARLGDSLQVTHRYSGYDSWRFAGNGGVLDDLVSQIPLESGEDAVLFLHDRRPFPEIEMVLGPFEEGRGDPQASADFDSMRAEFDSRLRTWVEIALLPRASATLAVTRVLCREYFERSSTYAPRDFSHRLTLEEWARLYDPQVTRDDRFRQLLEGYYPTALEQAEAGYPEGPAWLGGFVSEAQRRELVGAMLHGYARVDQQVRKLERKLRSRPRRRPNAELDTADWGVLSAAMARASLVPALSMLMHPESVDYARFRGLVLSPLSAKDVLREARAFARPRSAGR